MVIGINCGHTISGPGSGAVGLISESEHTRYVGHALASKLRSAGATVVDCTIDQAATQAAYLAQSVELANQQDLDWFVSIHFNASAAHTGHGVEVYTYEGRQYQDALDVCSSLEALGFRNRGVKSGTGLYVIKKTKAKAMLIEVCFCDNQRDVDTYNRVGVDAVAQAICNALVPHVAESSGTPIMGDAVANAAQLNDHLLAHNPQGGDYLHLSLLFLEEGQKEGVRGDIAFLQACKETGYFRFGGDVLPAQHNYAGLGATGGMPGLTFPDDRTGTRAQIQHLKAYATTTPLNLECVDPRYKYVTKGCAPMVEELSGKWAVPGYSGYPSFQAAWAAQDTYGHHIAKMLREVLAADQDEAAPAGYAWVVSIGMYKQSRRAAEELKALAESKGIRAEVSLMEVDG